MLHSTDLRIDGSPMRKANNAAMSSDGGVFVEDGKLSAWASAKVRECYNEVEQEDEGRKSIAAQILQTRNTDFLRRIIVPVQGHGGVTDVVRLPSLPPIPA